jgi:hypothetical protein
MPVILLLGRLRSGGLQFKVCLGKKVMRPSLKEKKAGYGGHSCNTSYGG